MYLVHVLKMFYFVTDNDRQSRGYGDDRRGGYDRDMDGYDDDRRGGYGCDRARWGFNQLISC